MKIKAYHGSGVSIDEFDYKFADIGNVQLGGGFYFTTCISEAEHYCTAVIPDGSRRSKPGGIDNPTIHEVELTFNKTINSSHQMAFKLADIIKIIASSPNLDDNLSNWGDIEYCGREKLIMEAAESYAYKEKVGALKNLFQLNNDFYPDNIKEFFTIIKKVYGFDSVSCDFDNKKHFVAWFPEQINVINRIALEDILTNRKPLAMK